MVDEHNGIWSFEDATRVWDGTGHGHGSLDQSAIHERHILRVGRRKGASGMGRGVRLRDLGAVLAQVCAG